MNMEELKDKIGSIICYIGVAYAILAIIGGVMMFDDLEALAFAAMIVGIGFGVMIMGFGAIIMILNDIKRDTRKILRKQKDNDSELPNL